MNVAFTFAGLRELELSGDVLASFPEAFRDGMAARADRARRPRAERACDVGVRRRARAGDGLRGRRRAPAGGAGGDPRRRRRERRRARVPAARRGAGRRQATTSGSSTASRSPRSPAPASSRGPATASPTARAAGATWPPARCCSATWTRTGRRPRRRSPPFDRNGTFVVYRKLQMDMAAFRRYVASVELPGRAGAARGQDRRPLARRHAADALSRAPGPRGVGRPAAHQRLLLRR